MLESTFTDTSKPVCLHNTRSEKLLRAAKTSAEENLFFFFHLKKFSRGWIKLLRSPGDSSRSAPIIYIHLEFLCSNTSSSELPAQIRLNTNSFNNILTRSSERQKQHFLIRTTGTNPTSAPPTRMIGGMCWWRSTSQSPEHFWRADGSVKACEPDDEEQNEAKKRHFHQNKSKELQKLDFLQ